MAQRLSNVVQGTARAVCVSAWRHGAILACLRRAWAISPRHTTAFNDGNELLNVIGETLMGKIDDTASAAVMDSQLLLTLTFAGQVTSLMPEPPAGTAPQAGRGRRRGGLLATGDDDDMGMGGMGMGDMGTRGEFGMRGPGGHGRGRRRGRRRRGGRRGGAGGFEAKYEGGGDGTESKDGGGGGSDDEWENGGVVEVTERSPVVFSNSDIRTPSTTMKSSRVRETFEGPCWYLLLLMSSKELGEGETPLLNIINDQLVDRSWQNTWLLVFQGLYRYCRRGLSALYDNDTCRSLSTYRFTRAVPLMLGCRLDPVKVPPVVEDAHTNFRQRRGVHFTQAYADLRRSAKGVAQRNNMAEPRALQLLTAEGIGEMYEQAVVQWSRCVGCRDAAAAAVPRIPTPRSLDAAHEAWAAIEGLIKEAQSTRQELAVQVEACDAVCSYHAHDLASVGLKIEDAQAQVDKAVGRGTGEVSLQMPGLGAEVKEEELKDDESLAAAFSVVPLDIGVSRLSAPIAAEELADDSGRILVLERSSRLRLLTPQPGSERYKCDTLMGDKVSSAGIKDGELKMGAMHRAAGMCRVRDGGFLIADTGNHALRYVSADLSTIKTVAGSSGTAGHMDGAGDKIMFDSPTDVCEAPNGEWLVADKGNNAIRILKHSGHDIRNVSCETLCGGARHRQMAQTRCGTVQVEVEQVRTARNRRSQQALAQGPVLEAPSGISAWMNGGRLHIATTSRDSHTVQGWCSDSADPQQTSGILSHVAGKIGKSGNGTGARTTANRSVPRTMASPVGAVVYEDAPRGGGTMARLLVADQGNGQILLVDADMAECRPPAKSNGPSASAHRGMIRVVTSLKSPTGVSRTAKVGLFLVTDAEADTLYILRTPALRQQLQAVSIGAWAPVVSSIALQDKLMRDCEERMRALAAGSQRLQQVADSVVIEGHSATLAIELRVGISLDNGRPHPAQVEALIEAAPTLGDVCKVCLACATLALSEDPHIARALANGLRRRLNNYAWPTEWAEQDMFALIEMAANESLAGIFSTQAIVEVFKNPNLRVEVRSPAAHALLRMALQDEGLRMNGDLPSAVVRWLSRLMPPMPTVSLRLQLRQVLQWWSSSWGQLVDTPNLDMIDVGPWLLRVHLTSLQRDSSAAEFLQEVVGLRDVVLHQAVMNILEEVGVGVVNDANLKSAAALDALLPSLNRGLAMTVDMDSSQEQKSQGSQSVFTAVLETADLDPDSNVNAAGVKIPLLAGRLEPCNIRAEGWLRPPSAGCFQLEVQASGDVEVIVDKVIVAKAAVGLDGSAVARSMSVEMSDNGVSIEIISSLPCASMSQLTLKWREVSPDMLTAEPVKVLSRFSDVPAGCLFHHVDWMDGQRVPDVQSTLEPVYRRIQHRLVWSAVERTLRQLATCNSCQGNGITQKGAGGKRWCKKCGGSGNNIQTLRDAEGNMLMANTPVQDGLAQEPELGAIITWLREEAGARRGRGVGNHGAAEVMTGQKFVNWSRFLVWLCREKSVLRSLGEDVDGESKRQSGRDRGGDGANSGGFGGVLWSNLGHVGSLFVAALSGSAIAVRQGTVTQGCLRNLHDARAHYEVAWSCAAENGYVLRDDQEPFLRGQLSETYAQMEKAREDLKDLSITVKRFFQTVDAELTDNLAKVLENEWNVLTSNDIFVYMRVRRAEDVDAVTPMVGGAPLVALPEEVVAAQDWLASLRKSNLFLSVMTEVHGEVGSGGAAASLLAAGREWRQLYSDLNDGSATFATLEYRERGLLHDERGGDGDEAGGADSGGLRILSRTARALPESGEAGSAGNSNDCWPVLEVDEDWVRETITKLLKWRHLKNCKESLVDIIEILPMLKLFLEAKGQSDQTLVQERALTLRSQLDEVDWGTLPLTEYATFAGAAEKIPAEMTRLNTDFVRTITTSMDLLDWLKGMANESDWKSGMEIALTKTELDCPPELWLEGEGGPGRPDEKKLSMLNAVRSHCHAFIYRVDKRFDAVEPLACLLDSLSPVRAENISNMVACSGLLVALTELLDDQTDNAATSQLMQFFQPDRHTRWVAAGGQEDAAGADVGEGKEGGEPSVVDSFYLKYEVQRKDRVLRRRLNESDLAEFQSKVVLGDTEQRGAATQDAIRAFVQQLGWLKRLSACLQATRLEGYFAFRSYCEEYPLCLDVDIIRNRCLDAERELASWRGAVRTARGQLLVLNYFGIQQIGRLVTVINLWNTAPDAAATAVLANDVAEELLATLNPMATLDGTTVQKFGATLRESWAACNARAEGVAVAGNDTDTRSNWASAQLLTCGTIIEEAIGGALSSLQGQQRASLSGAAQAAAEDAFVGATSEFLRIVTVGAGSGGIYQSIMLAYAEQGRLPDRDVVAICDRDTMAEELECLVRRWATSESIAARVQKTAGAGGSKQVFCIAGIERLSFDVQHRLATLIRDSLRESDSCLILVYSQGHGNKGRTPHLVSQFSQYKCSLRQLGDDAMCSMMTTIAPDLCTDLVTLTSSYAGCGKSFTARSMAKASGAIYVPVRVNGPTTTEELVAYIKAQVKVATEDAAGAEGAPLMLHMDLADTVIERNQVQLFHLIVFGGLLDVTSGARVNFNPRTTSVCIELACGDLEDRFSFCSWLPKRNLVADRSSFVADQMTLRAGMGVEFDSSRHDGTLSAAQGGAGANAWTRLHYVASALKVLRDEEGYFPHTFSVTEGDVHPDGEAGLRESKGGDGQAVARAGGRGKRGIPSEECFDLISKASDMGDSPSLWCLWNMVDVLYWEFKQLHNQNSPLNAACLPDKSTGKQHDLSIKQKLKGEIIGFLIATAREFATRQRRKSNERAPWEVVSSGFSNRIFNGTWDRTKYNIDEMPCFKMITNAATFFLYYRGGKEGKTEKGDRGKWVIDDVIVPRGAVYTSSKGRPEYATLENNVKKSGELADGAAGAVLDPEKIAQAQTLHGGWILQSASWEQAPYIKITATAAGAGGQNYRVAGCASAPKGSSASNLEDGLYLRQPDYDNVNGKPHYIKEMEGNTGIRRHLIFSTTENKWKICPVCNDDEGSFVISSGATLAAQWQVTPPDKAEGNASFTFATKTGERGWFDGHSVRKWEELLVQSEETVQIDMLAAESKNGSNDDDGAGGADGVDEDAGNYMPDDLVRWNESNHSCLLFDNEEALVSFLSSDPLAMRKSMHPGLVEFLENNHIKVGESLNELNDRHHEILNGLTGKTWTRRQAGGLLGGKYCLTGDALLKMLAIVVRMRCGLPVVLLGECGCGKTMLIKYLCAWLDVYLEVVDIHGGTTEQMIIDSLERAAHANQGQEVFVFFDEMNTCAHMGLLTEIICTHRAHGKPLPAHVHIISALNPYRRLPGAADGDGPGLVFKMFDDNDNDGGRPADPLAGLVYRVHPVPVTLQDFVFDFGTLARDAEKLYVRSIVGNALSDMISLPKLRARKDTKGQTKANDAVRCFDEEVQLLSDIICGAQIYVREKVGDPSATSLRDVARCMKLMAWFVKHVNPKVKTYYDKTPISFILALAFVYMYRLPDENDRSGFWDKAAGEAGVRRCRELQPRGYENYKTASEFVKILGLGRLSFCNKLIVDAGIAMNASLSENLFVTTVCILNKIPCFVVGKPGSSKTLTMQVIQSNLQGRQSQQKFWRRFPAINMFQYQCSPLSTAAGIQHQYDMAVRFQTHAGADSITVLLLDEVGLAEFSPDMPLKVMHAMLVNPPIAIVGLSNWVLDPAKMNRAICLQRPSPRSDDLVTTGRSIIGLDVRGESKDSDAPPQITLSRHVSGNAAQLVQWLEPLASAYHETYTNQHKYDSSGREFIGLRDYYSLLKLLRNILKSGNLISEDVLIDAICRNFGGRTDILQRFLHHFQTFCFGGKPGDIGGKVRPPTKVPSPVVKLIHSNLDDQSARHLMLLTSNGAALPLLFGSGMLDRTVTRVIVGSEFKEDNTELHLVEQINEVKIAMAAGETIVIMNHDNIYEALYDVLNQRYVVKRSKDTDRVQRLLRLAIGFKSQLCPVAASFRIVVIVEEQHAIENLDLPLLNRFEKQTLHPKDVLTPAQGRLADKLQMWVDDIVKETRLPSAEFVFCGFHSGTIPTIVLAICGFGDGSVDPDGDSENLLANMKESLARVAMPLAMLHSATLPACSRLEYFEAHANLDRAIRSFMPRGDDHSKRGVGDSSSDSSDNGDGDSKGESKSESKMNGGSSRDGGNVETGTLVLTTYSPVAHVDDALEPLRADYTITMLKLAEISSENNLSDGLTDFFSKEKVSAGVTGSSAKQLLVIQCEPLVCSGTAINHVKTLCIKHRDQFLQDLKVLGDAAGVGAMSFDIAVVVHLPPSIARGSRHYLLEMWHPWVNVFVDDLRAFNNDGPNSTGAAPLPDTTLLVNNSAHALISNKTLDLDEVIRKRWQMALSQCPPPASDEADTYTDRIRLMRVLFARDDFLELVRTCMHRVLEANSKVNSDGWHAHVAMVVNGKRLSGSLRETLYLALHSVLSHALATVIRNLDVNFNLSLLRDTAAAGGEGKNASAVASTSVRQRLWLLLAASPSIFDVKTMSCVLHLAMGSDQDGAEGRQKGSNIKTLAGSTVKLVGNTGGDVPLVSQFPFSNRVMAIFSAAETRDVFQQLAVSGGNADPVAQLTGVTKAIFGADIVDTWTEFASLDSASGTAYHRAYLQDVCGTAAYRYPGLSSAEQLELFEHGLAISHPDALGSPAGIHAIMWLAEDTLFAIAALIASPELPVSARGEMMGAITMVAVAAADADRSVGACRARLEKLGVVTIGVACAWLLRQVDSIFASQIPASYMLRFWRSWLNKMHSLTTDIREVMAVVTSITAAGGGDDSAALRDATSKYRALRLLGGFVSEILMPRATAHGANVLLMVSQETQKMLDLAKTLADSERDIEGTLEFTMQVMGVAEEAEERLATVDFAAAELAVEDAKPPGRYKGVQGLYGKDKKVAKLEGKQDAEDGAAADEDEPLGRLGWLLLRYVAEVLGLGMIQTGSGENGHESLSMSPMGPAEVGRKLVAILLRTVGDGQGIMLVPRKHQPMALRRYIVGAFAAAASETSEVSQKILASQLMIAGNDDLKSLWLQWHEDRIAGAIECEMAGSMAGVKDVLVKMMNDVGNDRLDELAKRKDGQGNGSIALVCSLLRGEKTSAKDWSSTLQALAASRVQLTAYAAELVRLCRNGDVEEGREGEQKEDGGETKGGGDEGADIAAAASGADANMWNPVKARERTGLGDEMWAALNEHTALQVYVLRCIVRIGGSDMLTSIMRRWAQGGTAIDTLGWLPIVEAVRAQGPSMFDSTQTNLPDTFVWLPGLESPYLQACGVVASACVPLARGGQVDLAPFNGVQNFDRDLHDITAALFTQTRNKRGGEACVDHVLTMLRQKELRPGCSLNDRNDIAQFVSWIAEGADVGVLPRQFCGGEPSMLQQLLVHAGCLLVHESGQGKGPHSWAWDVAFNPDVLLESGGSYIVSSARNEVGEVMKALEGRDRVGWYYCPNGHPYSVGECTLPMQEAKCDNCGALIGGKNHVLANGVRRAAAGDLANLRNDTPGYLHRNNELGPWESAVRAVVHIFVLLGFLCGSDSARGVLSGVVLEDKKKPAGVSLRSPRGVATRKKLLERLATDWNRVVGALNGAGDVDVMLGLHLALARLADTDMGGRLPVKEKLPAGWGATCKEEGHRLEMENNVSAISNSSLSPKVGSAIAAMIAELKATGGGTQARILLGEDVWADVFEEERVDRETVSLPLMMRYRRTCTLSELQNILLLAPDRAEAHPLLAAFLKDEEAMSHIQHIDAIFAWHAVLFEVFPPGALSRTEASEITNAAAVERLPLHAQEEAMATLDQFCAAFNAAFPIVEFIYECDENPFLQCKHGKVDLSGYRTGDQPMARDSPISFSLPTNPTAGLTDAPGLCTGKLLVDLQNAQNRILMRLLALAEAPPVDAEARLQPAVKQAVTAEGVRSAIAGEEGGEGGEGGAGGGGGDGDEVKEGHEAGAGGGAPAAPAVTAVAARADTNEGGFGKVPRISYSTPSAVRKRRLILYNREMHLLPLLHVHAEQSLSLGNGTVLDYDLAKIEAGLRETVLVDKAPIYTACRIYAYAGDMHKAGRLSALGARIPQDALPPSILTTIRTEVDTQARLTWLMMQLEGCLNFVLNVGGSTVKSIDGNTRLVDYVTETLMVPLTEWEEYSTNTLSDNVQLRHLQSLFMSLEECLGENPVDKVCRHARVSLFLLLVHIRLLSLLPLLPPRASLLPSLPNRPLLLPLISPCLSLPPSPTPLNHSRLAFLELPSIHLHPVSLVSQTSLTLYLYPPSPYPPLTTQACLKYREPLSDEAELQLNKALQSGCLDVACLVPTLRDFLVQQLSKDDWDGAQSLKMYLVFQDDDLEDQDWYNEGFPDALLLEHTYIAYKVILAHYEQ